MTTRWKDAFGVVHSHWRFQRYTRSEEYESFQHFPCGTTGVGFEQYKRADELPITCLRCLGE